MYWKKVMTHGAFICPTILSWPSPRGAATSMRIILHVYLEIGVIVD
jgi:hypothetical protein